MIFVMVLVGSVSLIASPGAVADARAPGIPHAGGVLAHRVSSFVGADPYADAVAPGTSATVVNPSNALGAPDGQFAVMAGGVGVWIVLDLGAGEEGIGDLDVSYSFHQTLKDQTTVDFLDRDGALVARAPLVLYGLVPRVGTVHNSAPQSYRYVRIYAYPEQGIGIDAVKTAMLAP